ncbi:MAG: hypothetical protein NTY36_06325 [Deltaproteobacteria bacterium]|nr:hypothetical protein [Deltaproteobacteria bacterium]
MPKIHTLGSPAKRKEFNYSGNALSGAKLLFEKVRVFIPPKLFKTILEEFKGQTIPGGFCMTSPTRGGLGEWVKENSNFFPRHASHIAAILVHEGFIESSLKGNAVYLHF